jgi:ABA sandwich protein
MSRELDAEVAERVMGWRWDEDRCRVCGWPLSAEPIHGCTPDNCSMRPPPTRRADEVAPYSTDIAAAWLVVEALRRRGIWLYSLEQRWLGEDMTRAIFEWRDPERGLRHVQEMCAPPPLAICLAALAAVCEREEK